MTRRTGRGAMLLALACALAGGPVVAAPASRSHLVVKGDTLTSIARQHGVTVYALREANRLPERGALRIGQRLVLPHGEARASAPDRSVAREPAGPRPGDKRVNKAGKAASRHPARRPPSDIVLAVPDFTETAPSFVWPVEGVVTSPYGLRRSGWHRGLDIKAAPGTPIVAAAAGVVVTSGVEARYGRVVKIEHGDGFVSVYAHNDENLVELGARVAAGARIATVGRTGHATTEHVHFEIRRGTEVFNPLYLLPLPPRVAQVDESAEADEGHD